MVVTEGEAEQVLDAGTAVAELFELLELLFKPRELVGEFVVGFAAMICTSTCPYSSLR
jgi:hypothetical protein